MEENQNIEVVTPVTPVTVKQPAGFYLTWQKVLVGFLLLIVVFGIGMLGGRIGSRMANGRMMGGYNQPGQYEQFQGNQGGRSGGRGGMMGGNNQPGQFQQYPNTGNYSCPRLQPLNPEPAQPSTGQ